MGAGRGPAQRPSPPLCPAEGAAASGASKVSRKEPKLGVGRACARPGTASRRQGADLGLQGETLRGKEIKVTADTVGGFSGETHICLR